MGQALGRLCLRIALLVSVALLGACFAPGVEGGTGGAAGTGGCFQCGIDCFDCGSGCQCGGGAPRNWVSPFPNTGADGTWRLDAPLLCPGATSLEAFDLWSDERGIYVLIGGLNAVNHGNRDRPAFGGAETPVAGIGGGSAGGGGFGGVGGGGFGSCVDPSCLGESVLFNDGENGWQRIHERREPASFTPRRMSGLPLGAIALYGDVTSASGTGTCALGQLDGDNWTCDRVAGAPEAFFGVNATLAYAAFGPALTRFDGEAWTTFGPPAPAQISALWADASSVAIVDTEGMLRSLHDDAWTTHGLSGIHASLLWGTAADDLWTINLLNNALVHFDGTTATEVAVADHSQCAGEAVQGMWGSRGTLYLHTSQSLLRWDGEVLDTLADWSCDPNAGQRIRRVWGNAPDEVFIALKDFNLEFSACGDGAVMYFDGEEFHAL